MNILPQNYQQEEVEISDGIWTQEDTMNFSQIEEWNVQKLLLSLNARSTLVKQITHIHFHRLTTLEIWGNQIESIEPLINTQMPLLQELRLDVNNIRSVRVLRKGNWPSLVLLSMEENIVQDQKTLTEVHFPLLEQLRMMDDLFEQEGKDLFLDPTFPAKLNILQIHQLWIKVKCYAIQRSIRKVLRKKWLCASIK